MDKEEDVEWEQVEDDEEGEEDKRELKSIATISPSRI